MQKSSGQAKLGHGVRFGLAVGLIGLALLVLVATPWGAQLWALLHDPSVEHARRIFAATTVWLPLVIIGLMILHTLVPVPAEILAFAAGMALGPFRGGVTIWVGAMWGRISGFFWHGPLDHRSCGVWWPRSVWSTYNATSSPWIFPSCSLYA